MNRLKTIRKQDLDYLSRHYLKYEPYSDFNVVSMWGYMIPGARYATTGDTVLYEMTDYTKHTTYLTIFGDKDTRDTIKQLATRTKSSQIIFEGVPESTCKHLLNWDALVNIEADTDNHDYIFAVDDIANMRSVGLHSKKKSINKLLRKHPKLHIETIDLNDPKKRRQIYELFRRWIQQSGSTDWSTEFRALKREIKLYDYEITAIGAYDDNRLVGFTINEIEPNGYYQGHFGKADYRYPGLGVLLEVETARIVQKIYGSKFMNLQQDLGIEGIRYYKQTLGPCGQLKKYRVVIDREQALTA